MITLLLHLLRLLPFLFGSHRERRRCCSLSGLRVAIARSTSSIHPFFFGLNTAWPRRRREPKNLSMDMRAAAIWSLVKRSQLGVVEGHIGARSLRLGRDSHTSPLVRSPEFRKRTVFTGHTVTATDRKPSAASVEPRQDVFLTRRIPIVQSPRLL